MKYDELKELGNENAVKAAGKYRQEGKNYEVHDGGWACLGRAIVCFGAVEWL